MLRQKVIGTNLGSTIVNQIPFVLPNCYTEVDLQFIVPRVVELTYTAWDLQAFYNDVWAEVDESLQGAILSQWQSNQLAVDQKPVTSVHTPFIWIEGRRALLRAELDAYYARLYGLSEQDLRYIMDPQDVYGPTFPGETFRVLKEKDIRRYGEYRTRRLVLEAFAKLPALVGSQIPAEYVPPVKEKVLNIPVDQLQEKKVLNKRGKIAISKESKTTFPNHRIVKASLSLGIKFSDSVTNLTETMKDWGTNKPIYSVADTVDILQRSKIPVNDEKVRRWFRGLVQEHYEGIQGDDQHIPLQISFYGLIELVVIGTLFDGGMSFNKIIKARRDLAARTGKIYPFATNNVKENLKKAGRSLIYEFADGPVTLDESGQYNLQLIRDFFDELVFDPSGVVKQILPTKGLGMVIIDPSLGDGKAVIKGKEVPVSVIASYYDDESSIPLICKELDLQRDEVLAAIQYFAN